MSVFKNMMDNPHSQTIGACFWMLLGSFLPVIVESLIKYWLFSKGFWASLNVGLNGGEIFILTTAMITPFFWLNIKIVYSNGNKKYPMFGWFFIFSIFSFFGGLLSFSYFRIGQALRNSEIYINKEVNSYLEGAFSYDFTYLSLIIYILSLIVWYYSAFQDSSNSPSYNTQVSKKQNELKKKIFGG